MRSKSAAFFASCHHATPGLQLAAVAILIFGLTCAFAASDGSLSDTNIRYIGRWDFSNPTHYDSYWGGAYIKVKFSGTSVKITVGQLSNLYYKIDSNPWTTYIGAKGTVNLTPTPLTNGNHMLSVAQGQDYNYVFDFQGLMLDAGATTSPPTLETNMIEFVGDSITTGYTDAQGDVSDYAWVCAETLNCEHSQIAYPGIDLTSGYTTLPGMGVQYFKDQSFAHTNSPTWYFNKYTPKVVVINLGQNDYANNVPDAVFQNTYSNFMANIRVVFPNAEIFALRTFLGLKAAPILRAVNSRNAAGDTHVHYVDTSGWLTPNTTDYNDGVHPSVSGHLKAARYLAPILAPYLGENVVIGLTAVTDKEH